MVFMTVLIVGAGIGGLTLALSCRHMGIDYQVFEASREIRPVGAGIWLPPNAMQILHRLGLASAIRQRGILYQGIELRDFSGNRLKQISTERTIQKFGFGTYGIHRADLHRILWESLDSHRVHPGRRFRALRTEGPHVVAEFVDGSTARGDLLIGADGIRSTVRRLVLGKVSLRYSGQTCWRTVVPFNDPSLSVKRMYEIWGPESGLRAGLGYIDPQNIYVYFTHNQKPGHRISDSQLPSFLLERFHKFPSFLHRLIRQADPESFIQTDLFDIPPLERWHDGRIALLGDAAHATTPNLGQGAAQAMESAYVLAHCLRHQPHFSRALQLYEHLRKPRATLVNKLSWHYNQLLNSISPLHRGLIFNFVRLTPAFLDHLMLDRIYSLAYLEELKTVKDTG